MDLQLAMIIQIDTLQINKVLIKGLYFFGNKTQDNKYYVHPGQKWTKYILGFTIFKIIKVKAAEKFL